MSLWNIADIEAEQKQPIHIPVVTKEEILSWLDTLKRIGKHTNNVQLHKAIKKDYNYMLKQIVNMEQTYTQVNQKTTPRRAMQLGQLSLIGMLCGSGQQWKNKFLKYIKAKDIKLPRLNHSEIEKTLNSYDFLELIQQDDTFIDDEE